METAMRNFRSRVRCGFGRLGFAHIAHSVGSVEIRHRIDKTDSLMNEEFDKVIRPCLFFLFAGMKPRLSSQLFKGPDLRKSFVVFRNTIRFPLCPVEHEKFHSEHRRNKPSDE